MTELRQVVVAKALGAKTNPGGEISDVEKETKNMSIIDQAMGTARKLAGTDALTEEMKRKEDKLEEQRKETDKVKDDLAKKETQLVEERLGNKIDKLAELYGGGASKEKIGDQISEIKKAAIEMGLGGSKVSEFKDMANLIQSLNPQKDLAQQIKDAKDILSILQPEKGRESLVEGVPAAVAVELKKLDADLKIRLEQMADARQERDQNFQITLKKWDEDRDIRRLEVDGKILVERERNAVVSGALKTIGSAIAEGALKGQPGVAGQPGNIGQKPAPQNYHMEIPIGEAGTIPCPNCKTPIGVGPTQTLAECVNCKAQYPITRIAQSAPQEPGSEPLPENYAEEDK